MLTVTPEDYVHGVITLVTLPYTSASGGHSWGRGAQLGFSTLLWGSCLPRISPEVPGQEGRKLDTPCSPSSHSSKHVLPSDLFIF